MKRIFLLMLMLIGALLWIPVFAQDVTQPETAMGFGTFAAMVAIIPFVTEIFKKIPNLPGLVIQILSWVIGVVLSLIGWKFNIGFLAGLTWYIALLYGIAAGLVANGVFDTGIINWILGIFGMKQE